MESEYFHRPVLWVVGTILGALLLILCGDRLRMPFRSRPKPEASTAIETPVAPLKWIEGPQKVYRIGHSVPIGTLPDVPGRTLSAVHGDPDGERFVSIWSLPSGMKGPDEVHLWFPKGGRSACVLTLPGVLNAWVRPQGGLLLVYENGLHFWEEGKSLQKLLALSSVIHGVSFSPKGDAFVAWGPKGQHWFDFPNGVAQTLGQEGGGWCLPLWRPDGQALLIAQSGRVSLVEKGKPQCSLKVRDSGLLPFQMPEAETPALKRMVESMGAAKVRASLSAAWSAHPVALERDRLYVIPNGQPSKCFDLNTGAVEVVYNEGHSAFRSPWGLSAWVRIPNWREVPGMVSGFERESPKAEAEERWVQGPFLDGADAVDVNPEGQVVLGCGDQGRVLLWETGSGERRWERVLPGALKVCLDREGQWAAAVAPDRVRCWKLDTGELLMDQPLQGFHEAPTPFSLNGSRLILWQEGRVHLVKTPGGEREILPFTGVQCMAVSPDGTRVALLLAEPIPEGRLRPTKLPELVLLDGASLQALARALARRPEGWEGGAWALGGALAFDAQGTGILWESDRGEEADRKFWKASWKRQGDALMSCKPSDPDFENFLPRNASSTPDGRWRVVITAFDGGC